MSLAFLHRHTWQIEAAVVGLVLATTAILTGNELKEWIGAFAVLFSFMHGQVSDRLAAAQEQMEKPNVECWRWAQRYFMAKEALWFVYFLMSQTYAALAGVVIFLIYPFWRKAYTKMKASAA
jgi:hypothetical protein